MKQESLKHLTDGANTLVLSSGAGTSAWGALEYWNFVNTNAAGIGVLLTLFFGFMALAFNVYNSLKLNQTDKNKKQIEEHAEKLKNVSSGIDEILNKLDK